MKDYRFGAWLQFPVKHRQMGGRLVLLWYKSQSSCSQNRFEAIDTAPLPPLPILLTLYLVVWLAVEGSGLLRNQRQSCVRGLAPFSAFRQVCTCTLPRSGPYCRNYYVQSLYIITLKFSSNRFEPFFLFSFYFLNLILHIYLSVASIRLQTLKH